ncbi:MAG: sigma-E processing peptidase SpoIIGA [Clostridia bacterium]|nr:sigma-E processing peptidase SpoIIGA [Clostridia bacterium]
MRIVNLDLLFLFNCAVDFLLLDGTRRLLREPTGMARLAVGALAGAAYAVVCALCPESVLCGTGGRIGAGLLMVAVSFRAGGRARLLRCALVFFGLSAALGGAVLGLYYLVGDGIRFSLQNGMAWVDIGPKTFLLYFAVSYPICLLGYRVFGHGTIGRELLAVRLTVMGRELELKALLDSGCSLCEPVTGKPAVVLERRMLLSAPVTRQTLQEGMVLLPCSTISGEALLPALKGERLLLRRKGGNEMFEQFFVALTEQPLSSDRGISLLLPHEFAAGGRRIAGKTDGADQPFAEEAI